MVGLEITVYEVLESEGAVEVCTTVRSPISGCPIAVPFTVTITASDDSAGILECIGLKVIHDPIPTSLL